jgi:hypothetical protein
MDFVIQNAQVVDGLGNVATRVVLKVVAGADTLVCLCACYKTEAACLMSTNVCRNYKTSES